MTKWEYKIEQLVKHDGNLDTWLPRLKAMLNKAGKAGWELCRCCDGYSYIFKRPLPATGLDASIVADMTRRQIARKMKHDKQVKSAISKNWGTGE